MKHEKMPSFQKYDMKRCLHNYSAVGGNASLSVTLIYY